MLKRVLSVVLVGLLLNMIGVNPVHAESKEEKEIRFIERVKDSISKLGTGTEARVHVKLQNKTELNGYISEVGENGFVVVSVTSGIQTPVTYPQVKVVKGNNLATGVKIAIGLGIALVLAILLGRAMNDGRSGSPRR